MACDRLQELQEERMDLSKSIHELAGKDVLTDEERASWDKANKRYDENKIELQEIDDLKKRVARDAEARRNGIPTDAAFSLRADESVAEITRKREYDRGNREEPLSLGEYCRAMVCGAKNEQQKRALVEGSDSAGGYLVPTVLAAQVIDLLRNKTTVLQAGAQTVPLTTAETTYAKWTGATSAVWRSEGVAVTETTPALGTVTFRPKSLSALAKASRELIDDAKNLDSELRRLFANDFAVETDRVALFGVGAANEPLGVNNLTSINTTSMGTNGLALADFTNIVVAIQSIEDQNAMVGDAMIMAPRTKAEIANLQDTTNQVMGAPAQVAAMRQLVTTQVPVTQTQGSSTDASTIFLGDWSELKIGIRTQLRIEVLKERYADTLEYGFLAWLRMDIQVWHDESFARIIGIIP